MPVPKEFLDIYEEEIKKEKIVSPPREFFWEKLRPRGEAIPEWTAKGEIVWRRREERKLTPKEEEEVSLAKEIRLLRQTADLGDRMEAFTQGILPVADKDILEKAFPLSYTGGKVTRWIGEMALMHGKLTLMGLGIETFLKQPMKPLAYLMKAKIPDMLADPVTAVLFSKSFPRMVSFATQRAIHHGADRLGENIIRGVTGKDLSAKKLILEPIGEAGFGAMLGGAQGLSGLWTSSLVAAGAGMTRETISQYIKDGKIDKEDIDDILITGAFYGLVEAVAHTQLTSLTQAKEFKIIPKGIGKIDILRKQAGKAKTILDKWRSQDYKDFMYNKYYAKLLGQGQTPKDAEFGATLMTQGLGPAGTAFRKAAYERVIKYNIPDQIMKPNIINEILDKTTQNVSSYKNIGDAFSKVIGDFFTKDTQNLIQTSILTQIDINNEFIKNWERAKTAAKPEIVREAEQAIADNQRHNEELRTRLEELQKRKAPLQIPVLGGYPVFKELPFPKKKEKRIPLTRQQQYGKALEKILTDKLKYTEENLNELRREKTFSPAKENTMTEYEMARTIGEYEDTIEQAAVFEDPSYTETLKKMDKLRMKYLKAHERGIFDEALRIELPEELQKDIGKDWTFIDWIRPAWRVFRKEPIVFDDYQYAIQQYGLQKRAENAEKIRARNKFKELGLTGEDDRIVTVKRHTDYMISHGQKDLKPIRLNEKQTKWDDWLTNNFEGLHSFFRLEKMIPFHMYLPYITETDNLEKGFLSELYPEYLPKNITAFFEKRRQSKKLDNYRESSLELYEKYIETGMKKKYMLPAIRRSRRYIIQNPNISANLKSHYQDWYAWQLGYPSLTDNSFTNMFTSMGLDYENSYKVARTMMDLVYMGGIGMRPMSAVRNLFQNINTASELGYKWTAAGFLKFMNEGGIKHARDMGILLEYMPELYSELGNYSDMQKLRDAFLFLYRKTDETNRSIAYYGAEEKFNSAFRKYGNTDKFYKKSGINFVDKAKRNEIRNLINQDKIDQARHEFGKEIVAKTQYLYAKENSPLIQRSIPGKLFFQFKSWPENYGELIADWGRNKNYMAFVRTLAAYAVLGWMGKELGQKWLTRTIPFGTLPVDQWRLERSIVPATIGPIADLLFLFTSPMMVGLETQDPEAVQKAFNKRLKALGKDTLLYLPGGLALKDFFKVAPIIPVFSGREAPQERKPFGELKFKSLGEGESKLRFKEIP